MSRHPQSRPALRFGPVSRLVGRETGRLCPFMGESRYASGPASPTGGQRGVGDEDVSPFTARILQRMAWRHAIVWLLYGIAAALVAVDATIVGANMLGVGLFWWAPATAVAVACVVLGVGRARRPDAVTALRRADRALGLHDRLTTAWEYRGRDIPILRLQRADLAERAAHLDSGKALPLRPPRRVAAPTVGVAALALIVALPALAANSHTVREQRTIGAVTHTRIAHATARIKMARGAARILPPSTLAALSKADLSRQARIARALAQLQQALSTAHTPAQALTSLAQAQGTLDRLGAPRVAAQRAALSALAASLAHQAATAPLADALRRQSPAAIAAATHALAASLAHISPSRRADLARALQAAAQAARDDPSLSDSLQNAATALARDDAQTARNALQSAGAQASADAARSAQQATLDATSATLDAARNDISGLTTPATSSIPLDAQGGRAGGRAGGGAGKPGVPNGAATSGGVGKGAATVKGGVGKESGGAGQARGSGGGSGASKGAGQDQASGQGQGAGQGQAGGQGQGAGQGRSGAAGGAAHGGGNGATGNRVYIPAPTGKGRSTTSAGPLSAPAGGAYRSLSDVLPRYASNARAYIENNPSLTPDQKSIVKRYFDRLSH